VPDSQEQICQNDGQSLNVLLGNDHLGWKGTHLHGVGTYFLNIIPKFRAPFRIIPCIMRKKDGLNDPFEAKGIDIRFFGRTKFDIRTLFDLIRIIRKEHIRVMHLQGYAATTFGRIAGRMTNVPVILHQRDADPNYPGYLTVADVLLCRYTALGLAVSEYTKEYLALMRKIKREKIKVLINPVDVNAISSVDRSRISEIKERMGFGPGTKLVGTITRFYPIKGVDCLLKAVPSVLKEAEGVKVVMCGDGPLLDSSKRLAAELGIENNVLFPGFVPEPKLWLSLFDVVVSSSYSEGCPNALLEAMAIGRPIVSTKSGGPEEFLQDGFSALMVPPGDAEGLAKGILQFLKNKNMAAVFAENARKAVSYYDLPNYMTRIERVYMDVVNSFEARSHKSGLAGPMTHRRVRVMGHRDEGTRLRREMTGGGWRPKGDFRE
jgi:glycosyltransferase involved in cell wall biosynthesis